MNSIVETKIRDHLKSWLHYQPTQINAILHCMRNLARTAGHELDERFANCGLGAGPECNVASALVDRALMGGGTSLSDHEIRAHCEKWIRETPPVW